MAIIKRIRTLKGAGVLAARTPKDTKPEFLRHNLIYGFNGSGKSTLSRIFACIQAGQQGDTLPEGCSFEIEMDDGIIYSSPDKLSGMEQQVCVFNTDFVEQNLRWTDGTATSIFYISKEQAEAAAELREKEAGLALACRNVETKEELLKEKNKTFATLKREQAKSIFGKLHLGSRKYEAPQLQTDYENLPYGKESVLTLQALDALEEVAKASSPPPSVGLLDLSEQSIKAITDTARNLAAVSVGTLMVEELAAHPAMVPWAEEGLKYHEGHKLESCVFCGNELTSERKALLTAAFDERLTKLESELELAESKAREFFDRFFGVLSRQDLRNVSHSLHSDLEKAITSLSSRMGALENLRNEIFGVYTKRRKVPTQPVAHSLPSEEDVAGMCEQIRSSIADVNQVIQRHNDASADFGKLQEDARLSIKRHFLADGDAEFQEKKTAVTDAESALTAAQGALSELRDRVAELQNKVRTHGPAADKITKLVRSYLGHGELTVVAAEKGYELHRHGKLVKGPPSEGEQTAIALCYFLSTLEADGREINNLIIVVDDPISSLDTKAMNYACSLIWGRLNSSAQLFVLTHNQHCMNEFKKALKSSAYPRNNKTEPTATLLYLDVRIPEGASSRVSSLVEMSALLREYDSEYHYLYHKVLEFEKTGAVYSEYGYMMPNVIRRVLEIFLAFKVPGSGPTKDKLSKLCELHPSLDQTRIRALERLSQVESHSDNLDDLIAHSSMIIEEARDANAALLELMERADEMHTKLMRRHCAA